MEDIIFELDGLQVLFDSKVSQLSGAHSSLTLECDRLATPKQHCRRSATGHLRLESLLAFSVSGFNGRVAGLVSDEMAAYLVGLTDVGSSASDSLKLA